MDELTPFTIAISTDHKHWIFLRHRREDFLSRSPKELILYGEGARKLTRTVPSSSTRRFVHALSAALLRYSVTSYTDIVELM